MLERKANVHFCCKCGKGMAYKEKSMVYLYKVETVKEAWRSSSRDVPKAKRAYNLCADCAEQFSELLDMVLGIEKEEQA